MADGHFQTLRALFRPWYVKVGSVLATVAAGIGLYSSLQDQFPDKLPKLQDMVTVSHALILPWWGWLLVLQAVLGFGLYDYVRKNVPSSGGDDPSQNDENKNTPLNSGPPPISTPQLAEDIRAEIKRLDDRLTKRIDKAVTSGEIVEFQATIQTQSEWAVQECSELGNRLSHLNKHFNAVNIDLLQVLDFGIDLATIEFLNSLISEAPKPVKPIADQPNEAVRQSMYATCTHYIQLVTAQLGETDVGHTFRTNMSWVIAETERNLPATDWPEHIKPVDYRHYAIVEAQLVRAASILEHRRSEILARVSQARGILIGHKRDREQSTTAKGASPALPSPLGTGRGTRR